MKVIILCGGMGMRLKEETEYKPKPMIEIGGKPILWHIMKHYAFYGYSDFILALGYKGDYIRDYFINYYRHNSDLTIDLVNNGNIHIHNKSIEDNWKITLAETGAESMTGYRIKLAGKYINGKRFMLTYGDAVSNINIQKLVEFSEKTDAIGTVTGVYSPSRFGDLVIQKNMVTQFKQQLKDIKKQNPINGGYFVFQREFLDLIPDDPTVELEKAPIDSLVQMNQLYVYKHEGFWQCMDTYRDYVYLNQVWQENPIWKIW